MTFVTCSGCGREVNTVSIACPTCKTPIGYQGGTPVPSDRFEADKPSQPANERNTKDPPWNFGGYLSHYVELDRSGVKYDGKTKKLTPLPASGYSCEFSVNEGNPPSRLRKNGVSGVSYGGRSA